MGLDKKNAAYIVKNAKIVLLNDMWDSLCYDMKEYYDIMVKLIEEKEKDTLEKKSCLEMSRLRDSILIRKYHLIKEVLDQKITGIKWDLPF